jgi:hypothetical protein
LAQAPAIVREAKGANNLFVFDLQNSNSGLYSSYIVPSAALPADYKQDGLPVLINGDVTNNSVVIDGYISESEGSNITLSGQYNTVEVTTMNIGILGKWKLVKTDIGFINQTTSDYSQYNIIYEFKSNNILTISGKTDDIEIYKGHEIGEHFYRIVEIMPSPLSTFIPHVVIDDLPYKYEVSLADLTLTYRNQESNAFLFEKNVYTLVKIK